MSVTPKRTQTMKPTAKETSGGQPSRGNRPQVVKPMLPPAYERMLRRQGADRYLVGIEVLFLEKGMQEIHFCIQEEGKDETQRLTAGEYQAFRNSLTPRMDAAKEIEAAKAFFAKLESRCWVKVQDTSPENARRVKSLTWPAPILTAFNFTQKDIKTRKLTPQRMFAIWQERSDHEKKVINAFQQEVDPNFDWVETLANYALFVERTKREEERKAKTDILEIGLKKGIKWGDVDDALKKTTLLPLQGSTNNPFVGMGEEEDFDPFPDEDEEEGDHTKDPLQRSLDHPKEDGEEEGTTAEVVGTDKKKTKGLFGLIQGKGGKKKDEDKNDTKT